VIALLVSIPQQPRDRPEFFRTYRNSFFHFFASSTAVVNVLFFQYGVCPIANRSTPHKETFLIFPTFLMNSAFAI